MQFKSPIISGTLIKRYKRFFADVKLEDGRMVTAHCPNTGAMTGCAEPGFEVWLTQNNDPKRKLKFSWEVAVDSEGHHIGINTHNANRLVEEALSEGTISELADMVLVGREVKYGSEASKIDFLLETKQKQQCYLEVKSVTLLQGGQGYFPDTKSERAQKHLRELIQMVQQGHRAVLLFCVQHTGINIVKAAAHLDPEYARLLELAQAEGVKVLAYGCRFSKDSIALDNCLTFG